MRKTLTLTAALLTVGGCGDSTGPERMVETLNITGGNFQLDTVTHLLPNPLRVEAVDGAGLPVAGQLVCYIAATEGAGAPFQPCLETDINGIGEMPWTLGTIAGDHLAQARAIVNNEPVAVADYVLEAVPGPAAPDYEVGIGLARSAQPRTIPDGNGLAEDQYGNLIVATCPIFAATDTIASNVGTTWPDCRSLLWEAPPADVVGQWATGTFAVIDSANTTVGHGVYEVRRTGDQAPVYLYAYGLDRPCSEPGTGVC